MKPNRVVVFLALLMILLLIAGTKMRQETNEKNMGELCWDKTDCITVEIMDTPASRQRGLMYRSSIPSAYGALLVFGVSGIHGEIMKNMEFSTDFIWLDANRTIVHLHENLQPCSAVSCPVFRPPIPAAYGVEVNGGYVKEHNLAVGMRVKLPGGL